MKSVKQRVFEWIDFRQFRDWIRPDPCNLPDIYLSIGDNIRTSGCQMPVDPGADAIARLPDIYRHAVKIAKGIASDCIGQSPDSPTSIGKVDRHSLFGRFEEVGLMSAQNRFKQFPLKESNDIDNNAVAKEMIGIIVTGR